MGSGAGERRRRVPPGMWVVAAVAQVLKRIGLGKALLRLGFRRMLSPEHAARAFAGYQPTAHDVFVATFGKSGTNWMMQIAQQIAQRGEAEFDHIHDVVAWPDSPVPGVVGLTDPSAGGEQSPTGLRVIKTHLATEWVPYAEAATYLTVVRDPKEVLVSSYYFLGGLLDVLSHVGIDDFVELFLTPGLFGTAWAEHTASFWQWRERPNALLLTFGDIKRDPRGCIERVAAAMGVALTDAELERVIERSDFAYMHAHESQFAPPAPPFSRDADRPRMVRSGRSGASQELLGPAQQAAIDRYAQAELRRLGSDLPYAELFDVVAEPEAG